MEASSSALLPNMNRSTAAGASMHLVDLPSRGLFSSYTNSLNPGNMPVYVCDHDTSPREDQLIRTNSTNILIRALTLKKSKGDSSSKDAKASAGAGSSKKRPALDKVPDDKAASKRPMTNPQNGSQQDCNKNFHGLTVERLRSLLKQKGLSPKGKKDELIARLNSADH